MNYSNFCIIITVLVIVINPTHIGQAYQQLFN